MSESAASLGGPDAIEREIAAYYAGKIRAHGPVAAGADWRDAESQSRRFEQLAKLLEHDRGGSVVDLGCGYGALARFLRERGHRGDYLGLDLCEDMIAAARLFTRDLPAIRLDCAAAPTAAADYIVASGIFNVRGAVGAEAWAGHVDRTLALMDRFARHGFAFNGLSLYSDPEKRRPHLHYGDPLAAFDRCKRDFAFDVALLHDYGLYEYTVIVRK